LIGPWALVKTISALRDRKEVYSNLWGRGEKRAHRGNSRLGARSEVKREDMACGHRKSNMSEQKRFVTFLIQATRHRKGRGKRQISGMLIMLGTNHEAAGRVRKKRRQQSRQERD